MMMLGYAFCTWGIMFGFKYISAELLLGEGASTAPLKNSPVRSEKYFYLQ